jgi:long-chain fatty acid transport protein
LDPLSQPPEEPVPTLCRRSLAARLREPRSCASRWLALGVVAATLAPANTYAAGFEIPGLNAFALGRGTAFAVRADDPSAIAYNPGALSRQRGNAVLYTHTLIHSRESFTRAPTLVDQSKSVPESDWPADPLAKSENDKPLFALGASVFATSDFGLDGWTFGVGVYGPSAAGNKSFDVNGGQRYQLTDFEALMIYYSLAVAYGGDNWGVGATLQYASMPQTRMELVVDAATSNTPFNPYFASNDVVAFIDLKDPFAFSAIVGGWFRPIPSLEVALSGRVMPVTFDTSGDFGIYNTPSQSTFTDAQLAVENSGARMRLSLPPTATLGLRYMHLDANGEELFDIEANLVYEAWSVIERFDVRLDGTIKLFVDAPAPDVVIEKRWRDTLSARLGGTFNAVPGLLGLSLGGYYEQGATPNGYEYLDFMSFDRFGVGAGVRLSFSGLDVNVAYNRVFQEDREVDERFAKVYQQRPLDPCPDQCGGGAGYPGVPSNAGLFESGYNLVALSLTYRWGGAAAPGADGPAVDVAKAAQSGAAIAQRSGVTAGR